MERSAFSCYVFTPGGRLLLTMRGHAKRTWPGVWTNTCHGHPVPGEPAADAVVRTLRAELGLVSVTPDLVLWDSGSPVYRVVTDARPTPDPLEVGDFEWVDWADFVYAVRTNEVSVSPWCRQQVAELAALGDDPTQWPTIGAKHTLEIAS
ncbi:NUDIX domain-containing protein [Saccharothrix variisporea]|uniref:isopentenyl-diphosphate Delta-isomerase n=1 Tax=Saccharothrix variisporea TaxID=543527 RepID=A0A495X8D0_9PSEU|nr:NUDIX domain-containing protein [Saccharothrix variisporea]RKT70207.1 isopentenyl-diphosphate delta-isomerase [Saccharothrix variisporea]